MLLLLLLVLACLQVNLEREGRPGVLGSKHSAIYRTQESQE